MQCSGSFSTSTLRKLFLGLFQCGSSVSYLVKQEQKKDKKKNYISEESELFSGRQTYVSLASLLDLDRMKFQRKKIQMLYTFSMTSIFLYLQRLTLILFLLQSTVCASLCIYLIFVLFVFIHIVFPLYRIVGIPFALVFPRTELKMYCISSISLEQLFVFSEDLVLGGL